MCIVISTLLVGRIRWKLREVLAARKISNEELARSLGKHPTSISRLKSKDFLPAIGDDDIEAIRIAITALSEKDYGTCRLSDLLSIEDN